ncbi:MAG: peptide synthetase [Candidatus Eisenbacteria bacterium]|uniref:Peptide synthetase n=1 Tax=Eiseniibacteriota bacterium TaxID=2212470 RepID=A0A538TL11_UNCEI|nr:MAG: peptide synthetase [Candidatus Eisenbacteria bacterium]
MSRGVAEPTVTAESTVLEDPRSTVTARTETVLAEVLAGVLRVDGVPVDSHFFEELGADSLVMAHFCARVRKRGDLPPISMRDVYRHPTIRSLAASLADVAPRAVESPGPAAVEAATPASTLEYVACGALQLLAYLGFTYLAVVAFGRVYEWISAGSDTLEIYRRLVLGGIAGFLLVCSMPILAKWVLIGRWKPGQIRLWSPAYVRFWIVKTLIRANPCALLFVGSPLYVLYLRALGAKIGTGVVIFSRRIPVCTDLLTIGAGTVIRKESFFQCYRAHAGRIETGTITIGRDAFIGERTVLDINTAMGDGTQLGHASALHSGQTIPAGERWHGSPAQRTEVNYLRVAPMPCGTLRRVGFCAGTLLLVFLVYLPFLEGSPYLLARVAPELARLLDPSAANATAFTLRDLSIEALELSLLLFFGAVLIGLPLAVAVPRILNLFLEPDRAYPLYGFHDRVQRAIARLSNVKLFARLFGDSSYIVHYLSWLGYRLSPVEQTGSNFGLVMTQANPCLCSVGTGTMVADGLAIINDEVSSSSFCVTRASIGPRNFLGNDVTYSSGARTGDNCLLATKVMVPLDGAIRENTGLLGSPCFEIPRTVDRDTRFDHLRIGEEFPRRLAAKNRHNIRTMVIFLFARWLGVFIVTILNLSAIALYDVAGHLATAALLAASLLVTPLYFVLVERCLAGFRSLEPTYCSIYDPRFWLHERLWKVPALDFLHSFDGSAYKTFLWRLMGVRIGRRVFDDGVHIPERTLATIGDHCALNNGSNIQCHSQEDATFKSDRTTIGAGCTIGVGALVHYGVTMGDGSALAAHSFLMKGEDVPAHARWGGNPAREMRDEQYQPA